MWIGGRCLPPRGHVPSAGVALLRARGGRVSRSHSMVTSSRAAQDRGAFGPLWVTCLCFLFGCRQNFLFPRKQPFHWVPLSPDTLHAPSPGTQGVLRWAPADVSSAGTVVFTRSFHDGVSTVVWSLFQEELLSAGGSEASASASAPPWSHLRTGSEPHLPHFPFSCGFFVCGFQSPFLTGLLSLTVRFRSGAQRVLKSVPCTTPCGL